jgi:N-acetylmuramoyl-L-alanine amidase
VDGVLARLAAAVVLACALAGCATGHAGPSPGRSPSAAGTPSSAMSPQPAPPPRPTVSAHSTASRTTAAAHSSAPTSAHAAHPASTHPPLPPVNFPPGDGPLVVVDPGHNGGNAAHPAEVNKQVYAGFGRYKACNTTGTSTNAGYPEHAFTFDVAKRVRAILQAHGVRVIMTRTNDTGVGPCVDRRAAIQSTKGVRAAVSIHADGAPSSGHGFHVNECSRRPEGATAATVAKSEALGRAEHDALAHGSGLVPSTYIGTDGFVHRSDFAGLNLSTAPTTFLEVGNMRNGGDAALQSSRSGRQRIAEAIAAGILAFLA